MKVTINVTRKSIRTGVMRDWTNCVIAKAILESLPLCAEVGVGLDSILMQHVSDEVSWFTDRVVAPRWIEKYIRRMFTAHSFGLFGKWLCKPFSFELDVPERYVAKEPDRPMIQPTHPAKKVALTESP